MAISSTLTHMVGEIEVSAAGYGAEMQGRSHIIFHSPLAQYYPVVYGPVDSDD